MGSLPVEEFLSLKHTVSRRKILSGYYPNVVEGNFAYVLLFGFLSSPRRFISQQFKKLNRTALEKEAKLNRLLTNCSRRLRKIETLKSSPLQQRLLLHFKKMYRWIYSVDKQSTIHLLFFTFCTMLFGGNKLCPNRRISLKTAHIKFCKSQEQD